MENVIWSHQFLFKDKKMKSDIASHLMTVKESFIHDSRSRCAIVIPTIFWQATDEQSRTIMQFDSYESLLESRYYSKWLAVLEDMIFAFSPVRPDSSESEAILANYRERWEKVSRGARYFEKYRKYLGAEDIQDYKESQG